MSPLKLFEYMASGTPILASRMPSLEEILDDNSAYFFEPDNINDFKIKLAHIIENQAEAQKIGNQAAIDVREHTWTKRAAHILNFLKF
jgi:glycosyltransferase involved in cell wall biosynthesis